MAETQQERHTPARSWRLVRGDDNGNVFVIAEFAHKSDAMAALAAFEAKAHKQTYWLEERPTSRSDETR